MKKVVLIGYMGAGKSTVGQALAEQIAVPFWDMDAVIEEKQGRRIVDIFAENGEDYFRRLETECFRELLEQKGACVLSAGGGLPLRRENRELLRKMGCAVYLQVTKKTVLERLKEDKSRPLLQVEDKEAKVEEMIRMRHPIYLEAADITVETDGRSVEEMVQEILKLLSIMPSEEGKIDFRKI